MQFELGMIKVSQTVWP